MMEQSVLILKLSNKKWRVKLIPIGELYWCWNFQPQVTTEAFPVRLYEQMRDARVFRSSKEANSYAYSLGDENTDVVYITAHLTWEEIVGKALELIDAEIKYLKYIYKENNKEIFLQDLARTKRWLLKEKKS